MNCQCQWSLEKHSAFFSLSIICFLVQQFVCFHNQTSFAFFAYLKRFFFWLFYENMYWACQDLHDIARLWCCVVNKYCVINEYILIYSYRHSTKQLLVEVVKHRNVLGLYFIPAFLYCLYNNLSFVNLSLFDPTTYYLLLQFRVVVTGILFQVSKLCSFKKFW